MSKQFSGKEKSFQPTVLRQLDAQMEKWVNNLHSYFTPYTKIILKCSRVLNVKDKTITLLKENIEKNLCRFKQRFLGKQKERTTREKKRKIRLSQN